jgi:hypothetical protein
VKSRRLTATSKVHRHLVIAKTSLALWNADDGDLFAAFADQFRLLPHQARAAAAEALDGPLIVASVSQVVPLDFRPTSVRSISGPTAAGPAGSSITGRPAGTQGKETEGGAEPGAA